MNKADHRQPRSIIPEQDKIFKKRSQMLAAAKAIDELDLGWSEATQSCVVADFNSSNLNYIDNKILQ